VGEDDPEVRKATDDAGADQLIRGARRVEEEVGRERRMPSTRGTRQRRRVDEHDRAPPVELGEERLVLRRPEVLAESLARRIHVPPRR
jgi:hypothetical protein